MQTLTNYSIKNYLRSGVASDTVVMLTLTSADDVSGSVMRYELNRFMTALKWHYKDSRKHLNYIVAREVQKRGVFHYHIALFDFSFIPVDLVAKYWRLGFVWLSSMRGSKAVAYCIKYVRKYNAMGSKGRLHGSLSFLSAWRSDYYKIRHFLKFNYYFASFLTACSCITPRFVYFYDKLLKHFQTWWHYSKGWLRSSRLVPLIPAFLEV